MKLGLQSLDVGGVSNAVLTVQGQTTLDPDADAVRLVELPLHSEIEDVVGGIDERAAAHNRMQLQRGILSHADRNLLFGILALQMDFISRDVLVAAMNAWVLDKGKPLGQVFLEPG